MMTIKSAFRQLRLRPALASVVILMLGVGIGATTALFSAIYQTMMQPLDVPDADRLVNLTVPAQEAGTVGPEAFGGTSGELFSRPMFRDLEAGRSAFTAIAAFANFFVHLRHDGQATGGRGVLVSGRYFDVLGVQPAVGRLLGPADAERGAEARVAVVSHDYWQSRLGADPNVVGDTLMVNGEALTIVGVAPPGFTSTMPAWRAQVFVPVTLRPIVQANESRDDDDRSAHWLMLFARLAPGADVRRAEEEINRLYLPILTEVEAPLLRGLDAGERERFLERRIVLEPGERGHGAPEIGPPAVMLLGTTVVVLVIVCVNVANLLLARGAARSAEMAIRASIGASRGRLLGQMLAESAVLAALGGVLSLPVAVLTMRAIHAGIPDSLADRFTPVLGSTTLGFALAATMATVMLFGVVPALRTSRVDLGLVIKGHRVLGSSGQGRGRLRGGLVPLQIGLSLLLLAIAGLFAQSLASVSRLGLGMSGLESIVSFGLSPQLNGYRGARLDSMFERVTERLAEEPGVVSVAHTGIPLMQNTALVARIDVPGERESGARPPVAQANLLVSPGFFETLGIPLLSGRDFTEADETDEGRVVIVNQAFVDAFGIGSDAIGSYIRVTGVGLPDEPLEIVGVVGDARYSYVKGEVPPQLFTPRPPGEETLGTLFFYIRAAGEPSALIGAIPRIMAGIDPDLPPGPPAALADEAWDNYFADRLLVSMSASFAGLATLLTGIGLYGVLTFMLTRRTRELGLRLALGAESGRLQRMVLKQVGVSALIGGSIGLVLAIAVARLASTFLFGLEGSLLPVVLTSVVVVSAVVLAASYLPARRASRVAPMEALRLE